MALDMRLMSNLSQKFFYQLTSFPLGTFLKTDEVIFMDMFCSKFSFPHRIEKLFLFGLKISEWKCFKLDCLELSILSNFDLDFSRW